MKKTYRLHLGKLYVSLDSEIVQINGIKMCVQWTKSFFHLKINIENNGYDKEYGNRFTCLTITDKKIKKSLIRFFR